MSKERVVELGNYWERYIEEMIEHGRYLDAEEVIREGLRILERINWFRYEDYVERRRQAMWDKE